jgi:hypothetical protein
VFNERSVTGTFEGSRTHSGVCGATCLIKKKGRFLSEPAF